MKNLKLYSLPKGYIPVNDLQQLYKLKAGKRIAKPENIIRDNQQIIFLFSEVREGFYRRILNEDITDDILKYYIQRQALYYKPKK